jgi:uncharacterized protein (TIGR03083 family)
MDISTHIDAVRMEGGRLATAAGEAGPEAPIPTCPDWAVRDLVLHVGAVHRWVTEYVRGGHTQAGAVDFATARGPRPADADLVDWFLNGHAALVAALESASPDLQAWTFLPAASPLAFWSRRQAHETCIHRVDAELAAARTLSPVGAAFAADGIDELVVGFASARGRRPEDEGQEPTSIAIRCTDHDASWIVRLGPEGVAATAADTQSAQGTKSDGAPDCTVRGASADLYLTLWRRATPEPLSIEGDRRAFELLLDRARI